MGTHCHQVLAFSTTRLAGELQLLPCAWIEADHDQTWLATPMRRCKEYRCETLINNYLFTTILPYYKGENVGFARWKADKEETKSFAQLCDQLASLRMQKAASMHKLRSIANSLRIRRSFFVTAELWFTN